MPEGQVLEFTHVTKRFNEVTAVADLSARVEPGAVTAFLGPNGAGKTTTLRMLLGQIRPTSGTATIGGTAYAELRQPLRTIGSVLEETAYRPRRTASRQLTIAAKANGIALSRVNEVLGLVGLDGEADSRIGGFSLGMRQRLSVAHALLGDPGALVFDEPANGLDPEGIRWMRLLMRRLADEGRTVLVSSHVLSEVEQVADNVLVLSKGQLVLSSGIETLADPAAGAVVVDAVDRGALTAALAAAGFEIEVLRSGLTVRGGDAGRVGAVAAEAGIALSTLVQRGPTLEDVFIDLVRGGTLEPRASAVASQLTSSAPVAPVATVPGVVEGSDADADAGASGVDADADSDADTSSDDGALPDTDAPADDDTIALIAEVEAVSAAVSVDAPSDPVMAAMIAAEANDAAKAEFPIDADAAASDDASTPSFDQILFGTPASSDAPAAPDASGRGFDDAATAFATPATGEESSEVGSIDETEETAGSDAVDDEDASGVEFFENLDDAASGDQGTQDTEQAEGAAGEVSPEGSSSDAADADPRSAAVSSMLAAAARAYYDDEPRDYPFAEQHDAEQQSGEQQSGEQHEHGDEHDQHEHDQSHHG